MESPKYAIVDLETTGHSHQNGDRIIQIAIVIMQDWNIQTTYTKFIHPGKSIPIFIQELTHITDEDVRDALPFEMYADKIYELLSGCVFVAHNADFDLSFLQAEFRRVGLPEWHGKKMDTVELTKIMFPTAISYKLSDLAAELQIPLKQAHRADDDAYATALVFKKCWEKMMTLPLVTLELIHKRSFRLKSQLAALFFDAIFEKRRNIEPITKWHFYKKIALLKKTEQHFSTNTSTYPETTEEKRALLQVALPSFEERPAQFQMMDIVWDGLNKQKETVIEASTGIGKTVGYLLPAYHYNKKTNKQIVISTYTSTLMDQLLQEEIPKLEQVVDDKVNVALLKGMSNYVDVERFTQILNTLDDSYDETFATLQVLIWLAETTTGDLNELNISGGGQLFVDKIRKTSYDPVIPTHLDFYQQAIEHAAKAQFIVTNHANVLADNERNEPLFGHVGGWIFDEAHQFIYAATSKNEVVFSYVQWKYLMGQVGTIEDGGLFSKIAKVGMKKHYITSTIVRKCERQLIELQKVFDNSVSLLTPLIEQQLLKTNNQLMKVTMFLDELEVDPSKFLYLSNVLQRWIYHAEEILQGFKNSVEELAIEHQALMNDWKFYIEEFKLKIVEWDELFLKKHNESVWIEVDRRSVPGSIQIVKKPVFVTEHIRETIIPIRQSSAIIWTSGTLTVPSNPYFITDQLCIDRSVPIHQLHAPKSYYAGAKSYIVTDMPDIQQVNQSEYIEAVSHAIIQVARTVNGRCFVLFTSQDMLKKTVELVQESNLLNDYVLFAQGVSSGSRMKLLKSFQKYNKSILFGTNSFWEGVDVPRDGLAAVIVVRLPFSSPEEPIFKAKSKAMAEAGLNSFQQLALPEAILRLKQGFGRLIRSSQDKGIFVILDRRIDSKSYGAQFIQAIPSKTIEKVPLQNMVTQLEHWYNEKR